MYYKVSYLKCRNSKKYPVFFVKFDEQKQTLLEVEGSELKAIKDARNNKGSINDISEFIAEIWEDNILQADLYEKINTEFDCKDSTTKKRVKEIEETPIPILNSEGIPHKLVRVAGKPVKYSLKPISEEILQVVEV